MKSPFWTGLLRPAGLYGSIFTLVSGSTAALALAYLVRPILTRLYTPEAFGVLGFFLSLVAILTAGASGRYDDALMLPADDRDARTLRRLASLLTLIVALACVPLVIWRAEVAALFGDPEIAPYLTVVPLAVAITGGVRIVDRWLTRARRFGTLSRLRVAGAGVRVPVQLGGGIWGTPWGLIGGALIDRLMWPLFLAVDARRHTGPDERSSPQADRIRAVAARYRRFPLYSAPAALLSTSSSQLPALVLLYFFDARVVGFFSQSFGLLMVPIALVGGSVGQVYFSHAAEARRRGTLARLTESVFRRLVMIGLFPTLALIAVGPNAVAFVLGEAFREAGVYARLLAPALFFVFASSPLSSLFDVMERQRANLAFNASVFAGRVVALLVGGFAGDARLTVGLFGLVSAVLWTVHTAWMVRLGGVPLRRVAAPLARYLACAVVPFGLLLLPVVQTSSPALATLAAAAATLLYFGLAFLVEYRLEDRG